MASKYAAQLDSFDLDIETLSDSYRAALAEYEYPGEDGAAIDHMGMKARSISFRCHFLDDRYDLHYEFLDYIQHDRVYQFVHPDYGLLLGKIRDITTNRSDRDLAAEIDIVFVEEKQGDVSVPAERQIVPAIEEAYIAAQAAMTVELAEDIRKASTSPSAAAKIKAAIEADILSLEAAFDTVAQSENSVVSLVTYGQNLPGRALEAVANAVARIGYAARSTGNAPSSFVASLRDGVNRLVDEISYLGKMIHIGGAQTAAVGLAELYGADEDRRSIVRREEESQTWTADGKMIRKETMPPLYDVRELEVSLAAARKYIQYAIEQVSPRGTDATATGTPSLVSALKTMARELLLHVNSIKLERDRVFVVEITSPTPLHAICLRYGLPHTYAERLISLNGIRKPNSVMGTIQVYARPN